MSRIVHWLPVCTCTLLVSVGVARADPRKPTHVACVGDSITAGSGSSDPSKNYVSQLQALLGNGVQVKNFGHSGATMLSQGHGDLPYDKQVEYTNATTFVSGAGAQAVVSVIIILGANDSKPFNWEPASGKNDQQYKTDYLAMVDHFLGLTPKPVVYVAYPLATGTNPCCSIRGDVIHDQEIPLIKQVAMEKHLPIIDLNTPTTGHPEYFGDGVHPNDGGYAIMAALVKKGLEREPSVSITSPSMGATVTAGMQPLVADANADTVDISSVEFFEGATSLGKAIAKPFSINWAATFGPHTITAKATDATLANKTSEAVMFTVGPSDMAGGTGGTAGSGGAAGTATGGNATGGNASGGNATGGNAAGGVASGGAPATSGGASAGGTTRGVPAPGPAADDAGCACSAPGSHRGSSRGLLALALGLAALVVLRRRAV